VNLRARVFAGIALVTGLLLLLPDPWFSPRAQVAFAAGAAALSGAVSAVAAARYRTGRDPHALFLSTGFAVLAAQSAIFGVWWALHYGIDVTYPVISVTVGTTIERYVPASSFSGPAPVYAFQAGWLIAGICFVLGVPWWDRRGRNAIRAWLVVLLVGGVVLLVDRVLSLWFRHPQGSFELLPARFPVEPRVQGTILGIVAASVVLIAAFRESFRRSDAPHPWLGVAMAAAITLPISAVVAPRQGLGYVQWADTLQLIVPITAIGALLSAQGSETSRMRRTTDRADEILGGRAEIASVIAHDVRSPVSSIKSIAASTIANYERLDDARRLEFVGMIDREAQLVLDVVHQMSVALKVDAGSLELVRRPMALAAVVRQAVDDAATNGRTIDVEPAPGLEANVDAKWLTEAIRQGIDNAVAFSPEGTAIRIAVEGSDGNVAIAIEDEGPGIPPEKREELFGRSARWRPPGYEDASGSGLGLFICRGIVREHGGEVTIDGAPGRGTILRISLPGSMV
jgi:two-component system, OmpR family, sensor histidine kinase SenX3